ncbi:MAG: glutamate--tRNA ligase [Oscillospiraceae bacterium]|nr:glutamate--tRNA ligase [Oscillospiraceae bacterium]
MSYFDDMEARIPKGRVRTRFAPSPTGYMHVGNLRTALYTYFIARHAGGDFILRIEDTDQKRKVEDAVAVIKRTMAGCGLDYDEGPDVGGPVGPYVQTERRDIYRKYAELLVEKGAAYRCFCTEERLAELHRDDPNAKYDGHCRHLTEAEIQEKLDAGVPYVIRQIIPEGTTTFHDAVYGDISVDNAELDDQVLLKSDGLPTYNFANVVDDHLMGITHVVRGSEYLSSAPKYNLLYEAFGWEIPTYVHCASVMITDPETGNVRKMSKRHGDPSYEDLLGMGYLSEAIKNYVSLLGWSPRGELAEQEFFDMEGLCNAFDIAGISKSPSAFDMEKLRYFNSAYLKEMAPETFVEAAMPWIDRAISAENVDKSLIPPLLQTRLSCLSEIPEMISFFEALPEYDLSLYTNKKNKLTNESSLALLEKEYAMLTELPQWTYDAIHDALYALTEAEGIKIGKVMWPLRIAAAGKSVTPGGAIEIALILGRDETLRRLKIGLDRLSAE